MVTTFCNSGAVLIKAGKAVSSDLSGTGSSATGQTADDILTEFINQAESYINTQMRINFTDTYTTLNDDVKKILEDAASCHASTAAINYDKSGYTTLTYAQTTLDVNWARMMEAIKLLKQKQYTNFITAA